MITLKRFGSEASGIYSFMEKYKVLPAIIKNDAGHFVENFVKRL